MTITLKALGALLTYPTPELRAALPEIAAVVRDEPALRTRDRAAVLALVDELAATEALEAEELYVGLFDRGRATSLHLFEHVHGESRDRGQAMVDLNRTYAAAGYTLATSELPDYLPVVLEYLSMRPAAEAREMLADCAHILRSIGESLRDRDSRYAAVFTALLAIAGETGLGNVRRAQPAGAERSLDEEWAEEPVIFGPAAAPSGCGTARAGR